MLNAKVRKSICCSEPLICIGYHIPQIIVDDNLTADVYFQGAKFYHDMDFSKIEFKGADFSGAQFLDDVKFVASIFTRRVNFIETIFCHAVDFQDAEFQRADLFKTHFHGKVNFNAVNFHDEVDFFHTKFVVGATFDYVLFEGVEKTYFDINDLSDVSFLNTDVSRIRFGENTSWSEEDKDKFRVFNERQLENEIERNRKTKDFNLGSIKAIYRGLRENYEYRMRYDEASQFFIREMELKRKYRESNSSSSSEMKREVKPNHWLRKHFSITGLYYHLFRYGESLSKIGITIASFVILTTLFWLIYPSIIQAIL